MKTEPPPDVSTMQDVADLDCAPGEGVFHRGYCAGIDIGELAEIGLHRPSGMQIYKLGSRSIVGEYELSSGARICLKYYLPKKFRKHLSYGIGGSRCRQSWEAALAFSAAAIPTPTPLAMLEWKRLGGLWLVHAFIATSKAEGISLNRFAAQHRDHPARLEEMAGKLREAFATMARHQITHGDPKATNILVSANDEITFLDLDAACVVRSPSRWKELRDRDRRIFHANWRFDPALAEVFATVL